MYFSRIKIDVQSATSEELEILAKGNAYGIHQILWQMFPKDENAQRDFLFRIESGNGFPFFYMVSERRPEPYGNLIKVETKTYAPQLTDGQRLLFSLRVNPVVTKKDPGSGQRARHDVIMDAKHNLPRPFSAQNEIMPSELEYNEGIKWIQSRSAGLGFDFEPDLVRVFGYQQHVFRKPKQKAPIRFSTLDFNGELIVTDAIRFLKTLCQGIGPAKAFGCGLMLIKRI